MSPLDPPREPRVSRLAFYAKEAKMYRAEALAPSGDDVNVRHCALLSISYELAAIRELLTVLMQPAQPGGKPNPGWAEPRRHESADHWEGEPLK